MSDENGMMVVNFTLSHEGCWTEIFRDGFFPDTRHGTVNGITIRAEEEEGGAHRARVYLPCSFNRDKLDERIREKQEYGVIESWKYGVEGDYWAKRTFLECVVKDKPLLILSNFAERNSGEVDYKLLNLKFRGGGVQLESYTLILPENKNYSKIHEELKELEKELNSIADLNYRIIRS